MSFRVWSPPRWPALPRRLARSVSGAAAVSPAAVQPLDSTQGGGGAPSSPPYLSWDEFFRLRRRLQLMQRLSGIPFVFSFWVAEGAVLSLPIFDPTRTILEMDPMVIVGLASVAGSVASYFVGATLTGAVWRRLRSPASAQLDQVRRLSVRSDCGCLQKQKDFYARITRYRANVPPNPTQMNFSFDFYGEKVRSVHDYRSWLRRQHRLAAERTFQV